MHPKRILIVSQYFWPEYFRINDLAVHLRARGHDLHVLTGQPNYPAGRFFSGYGPFRRWTDRFEGIAISRVPLWPRRSGGALNLVLNYLSFVIFAPLFGLFRLRGRFDCSFVYAVSPITQCLPAILYKWATGTPMIVWVQDLWPETLSAVGAVRNRFVLACVGRLVRFIYANSDLIMIQSEAFRANVEELANDASKIHYMPNWAEDLYVPMERRDVQGRARELPDGFRIVFAGNIGKAQALPTLLAAAERLREYGDIHWIILGDGTERERSLARVREVGLEKNVHFLGRLPASEMPHYFAMGDALVVTLKAEPIFSYTIPARIQSYFACGRPVLAALDGEGQRVIRQAQAGFVGPAEDAEALAENALKLYRLSYEERAEMGRRGLDYYRRHFARDRLIEDLEQRLNSLELKVSPV